MPTLKEHMERRVQEGVGSQYATISPSDYSGLSDDELRMLDAVTLAGENEGRFYPDQPKKAAQAAIKEYVKTKTDELRDTAKAIEKHAVRAIQSSWMRR